MTDNSGVLVLLLGVALLPTVVAMTKQHHNRGAIVVLNLLSAVPALAGMFFVTGGLLDSMLGMQTLGVAFLMWSTALVWACTVTHREEQEQPERSTRRIRPHIGE